MKVKCPYCGKRAEKRDSVIYICSKCHREFYDDPVKYPRKTTFWTYSASDRLEAVLCVLLFTVSLFWGVIHLIQVRIISLEYVLSLLIWLIFLVFCLFVVIRNYIKSIERERENLLLLAVHAIANGNLKTQEIDRHTHLIDWRENKINIPVRTILDGIQHHNDIGLSEEQILKMFFSPESLSKLRALKQNSK